MTTRFRIEAERLLDQSVGSTAVERAQVYALLAISESLERVADLIEEVTDDDYGRTIRTQEVPR